MRRGVVWYENNSRIQLGGVGGIQPCRRQQAIDGAAETGAIHIAARRRIMFQRAHGGEH